MKITEIITEAKRGKMSKRQKQSTRGVHTYSDAEKMNSDYTAYRLGMAVAGCNGKDPAEHINATSWVGKKKSAHPYSKEESDMLKQAYKAVGASYDDLNHGDMESKELDTINRTSPVAKPKRNKYGV